MKDIEEQIGDILDILRYDLTYHEFKCIDSYTNKILSEVTIEIGCMAIDCPFCGGTKSETISLKEVIERAKRGH